ncbi:MAG TPA: ATP-dependent DNA helicase [Gemmatimonadaceae bacterium]|jgi:DNA helicase-2/ATP-dependent DNA helicase PcrA
MRLTPEQHRATQDPSANLQLIACAGSGKTEVIARRVANLLKANGTPPSAIIAFTFTERAAAELKERIRSRVREELGDVNGMAEMYVGTIHGFALDLLKTESPKYLKYEVLNEVQQFLFIDRHSAKSGLTTSSTLAGELLHRYKDTANYFNALSILREAKLNAPVLAGNSIVAGLEAYRELLESKRYLDYSAILEEAAGVLETDAGVRDRLAARVQYVIVDEYQDINPVQERIVSALHSLGAYLCVVGDDDQTLYQWRGSDVRGILEFADRYADVQQIRLQENFRSSQGIVETARDFIAQNTERLDKAMVPAGSQVFDPYDIVALGFENPESEAAYIAETIKQLRGAAFEDGGAERGLSWSDMAVLLRTVKGSGAPITQALAAAGIPYIVVGMNELFETAEAEAARQLFYFLAGRVDVTAASLGQAWEQARTGADAADLQSAIGDAAQTRTQLEEKDEQRWSFYNLQRSFLAFMEKAGIREERIPDGRGEIVFYNLGKFSQVISDFEAIHFHSQPAEKYESFANFLQYRAESSYPEGWQNNVYANPDAVRVMTVHQAKGMQWPAVFVPALLRNRFPAKGPGGRNVWHLLPKAGVVGQERYEGTLEDERRLFYVAVTRSQKFLHLTWAPVPGNRLFQKPSQFFENAQASPWVKRRRPDYANRKRLAPQARAGVSNVVLSFSDLKYFFECPYQFKLRVLYGFNAPIDEALGYGKSLHDALAEVHGRAIRGDVATPNEAQHLVAMHMHAPYAYPALREALTRSAEKAVADYLRDNSALLPQLEFAEKTIDIHLDNNVSVVGRIDLVRRRDTGETTIVDLKSTQRAQTEELTEQQLHVYALGYEELTGRRADFVEIYNLDERKRKPRAVDEEFIEDVKRDVRNAAASLRAGDLSPKPEPKKCQACDYCRMCTAGLSTIDASPTLRRARRDAVKR